jgi:hypothetical protein
VGFFIFGLYKEEGDLITLLGKEEDLDMIYTPKPEKFAST